MEALATTEATKALEHAIETGDVLPTAQVDHRRFKMEDSVGGYEWTLDEIKAYADQWTVPSYGDDGSVKIKKWGLRVVFNEC